MRYISAEELKHLLNASKYYDTKEGFAFSDMICECKTADVQEIKHGKWIHLGGGEWYCSECGFVITTEGIWDEPTGKYCTECGAKIDRSVYMRYEENNAICVNDVDENDRR